MYYEKFRIGYGCFIPLTVLFFDILCFALTLHLLRDVTTIQNPILSTPPEPKNNPKITLQQITNIQYTPIKTKNTSNQPKSQ